MEALVEELNRLKARATRLEQEVDNEPDKDREMAKRAELTAVNNCIAQLQKTENILLEQSRGNFLFLRREFVFSP